MIVTGCASRACADEIAALTYGELAAACPMRAGQYVYLPRSHSGPLSGFLFGVEMFLVIGDRDHPLRVAVAFAEIHGAFRAVDLGANYLIGQGKVGVNHAAGAGHQG